ncbi:MAG: hypothetical protein E6K60_00130 [Nitrospirae bacterium]|nr:MAG: hypothetical protein E6K60_00130 [Nitrospirota bacterium]
MDNTSFRIALVLWLFFSVLVSISDPTDLTGQAVPAVLEYVEDLKIGDAKFKDLSIDVLLSSFSISVATGTALSKSRPYLVLRSSAPDRYMLLSTYRI